MNHQMHHEPHDHGVHGMLLIGEQTLYLSHLPMFMSMHDHQVILEVTLARDQDDPHAIYRADRRNSGERLYTLVPEKFSLQRLGGEDEDALRTFKSAIHRGHFEKPGNRAILEDVTVNVVNIVHFRKLDPDNEDLPELRYLLFGRGEELYLAHLISRPPDFDQIVQVASISHNLSEETLRRGVHLAFPDRANQISARLRDGMQALGQMEVAIETAVELYLEEGELSQQPTFNTTAEEHAAGFP
jgi:hypothetical protein